MFFFKWKNNYFAYELLDCKIGYISERYKCIQKSVGLTWWLIFTKLFYLGKYSMEMRHNMNKYFSNMSSLSYIININFSICSFVFNSHGYSWLFCKSVDFLEGCGCLLPPLHLLIQFNSPLVNMVKYLKINEHQVKRGTLKIISKNINVNKN